MLVKSDGKQMESLDLEVGNVLVWIGEEKSGKMKDKQPTINGIILDGDLQVT